VLSLVAFFIFVKTRKTFYFRLIPRQFYLGSVHQLKSTSTGKHTKYKLIIVVVRSIPIAIGTLEIKPTGGKKSSITNAIEIFFIALHL